MFRYSMVKMVRSHAKKMDRPLRQEVLNLYKPFTKIPCFFHKLMEKQIKKRKKISVIIEFKDGTMHKGKKEIENMIAHSNKCQLKRDFPIISCCSADITPSTLENMLERCHHIRKVHLNRKVHALLDTAVDAAHAKHVTRNGTELTGQNVTVAVIDTGVHPHQDLSDRIIDFIDLVNERSEPYDDNGHGTHCAGAVAGDGLASSGQYKGPAPEANIIGIKALDKMGAGSLDTIIQAIERCIKYNEESISENIDIISLSLGTPAQRYETEDDDPMVRIVERAWESGIVVCAAAGNDGPDPQTIASPGISDKVITVGALDDRDTDTRSDDDVAEFSSRGPTIYGKEKPDLLAPGVDIVSLRAPNSFLDKYQKNNRVGSEYFALSGTSMATPICAGIVALMLQHDHTLTPENVKTLLKSSTHLWRDRDPHIYGAGYIHAEQSIPDES